ncbi:MAG: hypothetical protein V3V78_04375 [Candidatus Woesearchaeota archaeon]
MTGELIEEINDKVSKYYSEIFKKQIHSQETEVLTDFVLLVYCGKPGPKIEFVTGEIAENQIEIEILEYELLTETDKVEYALKKEEFDDQRIKQEGFKLIFRLHQYLYDALNDTDKADIALKSIHLLRKACPIYENTDQESLLKTFEGYANLLDSYYQDHYGEAEDKKQEEIEIEHNTLSRLSSLPKELEDKDGLANKVFRMIIKDNEN